MRTYHFTYIPEDSAYSKGVNIEAESMLEAIASFSRDFTIEPLSCVDRDQNIMIQNKFKELENPNENV
jgi:hypothetical protein